jgi:hypothetical protein
LQWGVIQYRTLPQLGVLARFSQAVKADEL